MFIKNKTILQTIWGVLLVAAGIGIFCAIPQKMAEIAKTGKFTSSMFFIRFSFYFIGIFLIGGGLKKLYANYHKVKQRETE